VADDDRYAWFKGTFDEDLARDIYRLTAEDKAVNDRPVDVRLAEALGWTGLELRPDGWWGRDPETGFRDPIKVWSQSYAWCGEVAELNRWCLNPFSRMGVCLLVIHSIYDGETVRLPGGRVING
jgi:hypothetical protein